MKIQADGTAYAERTTTDTQAEANNAQAGSLRERNQELIAAFPRIIEALPAIVQAAAQGIAGSNLTILNGTEGIDEVAGLVGQGLLDSLDTLKKSTAAAGNGELPAALLEKSRQTGS